MRFNNAMSATPETMESDLLASISIAAGARFYWAVAGFAAVLAALLVSGCALPDKPLRASMYDFGPGVPAQVVLPAAQTRLGPVAIDEIVTPGGALDNMAVLYRLAYTDAQQLRPYSQARWTMPPAQLVRQRLREQFSQRRVVFNAGESAALNRSQNQVLPLLLRLDLEEFSQLFTSPVASVGLIRLQASLLEVTPAGERLLGQRHIVVQRPATTADAAGGVRALTAATDGAIEEIDQWLQQTPAR